VSALKAGAISALRPLSDERPDMSSECSKIELSQLYLEHSSLFSHSARSSEVVGRLSLHLQSTRNSKLFREAKAKSNTFKIFENENQLFCIVTPSKLWVAFKPPCNSGELPQPHTLFEN